MNNTSTVVFKVTNKRDKIEKAFVREFNNSDNQVITFKTDLCYNGQDLYFSITPKNLNGGTDEGYFIFWTVLNYPYSILNKGQGEYERLGDCVTLFNVFDSGHRRLYDRRFKVETVNGITLTGEYISSRATKTIMTLDIDGYTISRKTVIGR